MANEYSLKEALPKALPTEVSILRARIKAIQESCKHNWFKLPENYEPKPIPNIPGRFPEGYQTYTEESISYSNKITVRCQQCELEEGLGTNNYCFRCLKELGQKTALGSYYWKTREQLIDLGVPTIHFIVTSKTCQDCKIGLLILESDR